MPFESHLPHVFTPISVRRHAPAQSGVYGLSSAANWIYIGATDNIQATLLEHIRELEPSIRRHQPTGLVLVMARGVMFSDQLLS